MYEGGDEIIQGTVVTFLYYIQQETNGRASSSSNPPRSNFLMLTAEQVVQQVLVDPRLVSLSGLSGILLSLTLDTRTEDKRFREYETL